jgi:cellulose biosynthesis protein BcsQ
MGAALVELGHRVLLVDSDPQCNLTSYLVEGAVVDDLLDNSDGPQGQTVWSAVKPISEALGGVRVVKPIETATNGLFLIPGDIRLSEFEADLSDFWSECLQRKPRGFRGTTALSELVTEVSSQRQIEIVFFDSGPNIGPLNRAILLDCDFFIVPVAYDLFSLRALKALGRTLVSWINDWATISDLAPEGTYLLSGRPAFLGYIAGGFKVYAGGVALQHTTFRSRIEKEIYSQIVSILRGVDPELAVGRLQDFKLGEVKHLGALVPASQNEGQPVYNVSAGSPDQRSAAHQAFGSLASKVEKRLREAAGR